MSCRVGSEFSYDATSEERKGQTLSFCDMGASAKKDDNSSESSESSPSSPSSPASCPTCETQLDKLGEVMEACGVKASQIIRNIYASYTDKEKLCGLRPQVFQTGAWERITVELFKELVGVKCFTECPAMQLRLLSVPSNETLKYMAEQISGLAQS